MLRQTTKSAVSKLFELCQRQRTPTTIFTSLQKDPCLHHFRRTYIVYRAYSEALFHSRDNSTFSLTRNITSYSSLLSSRQSQQQDTRDLATQDEDPFDTITDKIPEKPVTFVEGASYTVAILVGLAIAFGAAYAVFKELIFEPKEYTIFGKALERVQNDNQVTVRLGLPIKGYGQESRNRSARQRISNRSWTDEDGVERIEVQFHIRGPRGAGIVHSEMFKDKVDKKWKFTYLLVNITSPSPTRLMLESYVPN